MRDEQKFTINFLPGNSDKPDKPGDVKDDKKGKEDHLEEGIDMSSLKDVGREGGADLHATQDEEPEASNKL